MFLKCFTEPEELDDTNDPFANIEITADCDTDGSNDGDNTASFVADCDDDDLLILRTIETLILENDISLDSAANSEDESIGSENGETDSEVEDAGFQDEGMDIDGDDRAS